MLIHTILVTERDADICPEAGWYGSIMPLASDKLREHLREPANTGQRLITDPSRIRTDLGYTKLVSSKEDSSETIAWDRASPLR